MPVSAAGLLSTEDALKSIQSAAAMVAVCRLPTAFRRLPSGFCFFLLPPAFPW